MQPQDKNWFWEDGLSEQVVHRWFLFQNYRSAETDNRVWYNAGKADSSAKYIEEGGVTQMAKEPKHIDISSIPELLKLVHEVRQTNEPTILREEREDVALLSPVPAKNQKAKGKAVTSDDALFRLIGIGKSGIPGGVSGKKHEYLARAYRPR
jgi:hypothetical protein